MMTVEEIVKSLGFDSEQEFHSLNSSPDLSNPETMKEYLNWRDNDGTKTGLVAIIEKYKK